LHVLFSFHSKTINPRDAYYRQIDTIKEMGYTTQLVECERSIDKKKKKGAIRSIEKKGTYHLDIRLVLIEIGFVVRSNWRLQV
jgi:hypothetical protein